MPVLTYLEAVREGLREAMAADERVFLLGEDIARFGGAFKGTRGLVDDFGEDRVLDTPLAESAIVGTAIGAALLGMRPVAEMQFADFVTCGFNQLVNNAATIRYRWGASVPLTLRLPTGGGIHGGPFHSRNTEAWFVHCPGLKVVAPSTPAEAKGLLLAAIADPDPVLFYEHKFLYRRIKGEVPETGGALLIGSSDVKREGRDLTIVTYGATVHAALEAAETLDREGVSCEVLDMRSLLPYDKKGLLASVHKTHRALVVHEANRTGGVGGEFAATIAEEGFESLDAPVRRLAAPDTPVPFAPPLEAFFLPDAAKITDAARALAAF